MKAYPAYKSSGVEWLEEIPENWEFRPIKRIFSEVDIKKGDAPYPLLSFSREKGLIIPPIDKKGVPDDLSCYKVLKKGQLLENRMQAWSGMFICADKDGCVSPDYSVFEAIDINTTSVKFYEYVFRNHIWVSLFANASKGIGTGFNRLYTPQFGAIKTIFPPYEEQNVIVAYLDKKCAEIEELISRRQAIIDRLKELKQSIIADAVTKGLNPDVPMKDSGTAWQGKVPAHWKKNRNKNEIFPKVNHVGDNPNKLPMLSLTKKGVIVRDLESGKGKFSADESKFLIVEPGDFVFCHYDIQETPRTVGLSSHLGYITGSYNIYGFKGENSQFFYYLHECFDDRKLLCPLYKGLRNTIRQDRFLSMRIFLPPAEEQKTIVAYLDKKCGEIDELVARQEQIIEKLKELKTSTIAHVVTGKVDVRDAI